MIRFATSLRPALLLAALLLGFGAEAQAQYATRGVAPMGMAGGGVAYVRDTDALYLNPANLAYNERNDRFVLSFGDVYVFSGGDLLQFGYYNDFLTAGRTLSTADKREMLDGWFGNDMRKAGGQAEVALFSLAYHGNEWGLGLGVRARAHTLIEADGGLLNVALFGTDEDRTIPVNGGFSTYGAVDISVAYGRMFMNKRLAVGLAPKLVLGIAYGDAEFRSTVTTVDTRLTHQYDYTIEAAGNFNTNLIDPISLFDSDPFGDVEPGSLAGGVAGTGFGLDLGASYYVRPDLQIAMSLTDLGAVSWSTDTQTITPTVTQFVFEGLELDLDELDERYDGSFGDYAEAQLDSLARDSYNQVNRLQGETFTSTLPTALHIGTAWQPARRTLVTSGVSLGLVDAPGNLSHKPAVYAGVEHRLGPVPLRAGARLGGEGALMVAFGFGLRTRAYDLNIGLAVTPVSDAIGAGARYALGVSLINIRI